MINMTAPPAAFLSTAATLSRFLFSRVKIYKEVVRAKSANQISPISQGHISRLRDSRCIVGITLLTC